MRKAYGVSRKETTPFGRGAQRCAKALTCFSLISISEGFDKNEAIRLIACVVSDEIYYVMKEQRPFDEKRFVEMLKKLPKLPWE
jgi:hypothetical protein